jgi:alkyl sulfatase BDS1-like metallo-beta-lactamase superfamily hydrolase
MLICASCSQDDGAVTPTAGNLASQFTVARQAALRDSLPFEDQRDFDESRRGFIAAPDYRRIEDRSGNTVWDIGKYDFLLTGEEFDSIHPSLQRQATLNMNYGLFEVVPGKIYQVRGFDLANMTVVRGETGWIVFDVLLVKETAAAALELVNQQLGERPVTAVVYSHSHADHFGGIHGVVDEEDVRSTKRTSAQEKWQSSRRVDLWTMRSRRIYTPAVR